MQICIKKNPNEFKRLESLIRVIWYKSVSIYQLVCISFKCICSLILWDSCDFYYISHALEYIISSLTCLISIFFTYYFTCAFANSTSHLIYCSDYSLVYIWDHLHSSFCSLFCFCVGLILLHLFPFLGFFKSLANIGSSFFSKFK